MKARLVCLALSILFTSRCSGDYTLSVLLKRFDAGQGFLANGEHCDPMWFSNANCNLRLKICVEVLSDITSDDLSVCNQIPVGPGAGQYIDLGNVTDNKNQIVFRGNGAQYGGWSNPMRIVVGNGKSYKGFRIKVQASNYYGNTLQEIAAYLVEPDPDATRPVDFEYYSEPRTMAPEPTLFAVSWSATGDGVAGPATVMPPAPTTTRIPLPGDCSDDMDGRSTIRLPNGVEMDVMCNKASIVGSYMVIQSRTHPGTTNFNRPYNDYRTNFGFWDEDNWFGLENLFSLTSGNTSYNLLVEGCCDGPSQAKFSDLYQNFRVGSASAFYPINAIAIGSSVNYGLDQAGQGGLKDLGAPFSINNGNLNNWHSILPFGLCRVATGGGGWWFGNCRNHLNAAFIPRNLVDPSTCRVNTSLSLANFASGLGAEYRRSATQTTVINGTPIPIDGIAYTKVRMSVARNSTIGVPLQPLQCS